MSSPVLQVLNIIMIIVFLIFSIIYNSINYHTLLHFQAAIHLKPRQSYSHYVGSFIGPVPCLCAAAGHFREEQGTFLWM